MLLFIGYAIVVFVLSILVIINLYIFIYLRFNRTISIIITFILSGLFLMSRIVPVVLAGLLVLFIGLPMSVFMSKNKRGNKNA